MFNSPFTKTQCEFLRTQSKQRFDKIRSTWVDLGQWALPHRVKWMLSQTEGLRNNHHIVDITHILALRSFVAGFLEGNTSATRPWYRTGSGERERDANPINRAWLDTFTSRTLKALSASNFYHAAGGFYYDYGTFNTGAHYIEELDDGNLFFHVLIPGSYYVLNDSYGEAATMVREFSLTVKGLVDRYGKNDDGTKDWSNISSNIRKMYDDGNYSHLVDIVQVIKDNPNFDPELPVSGDNRQWVAISYELGGSSVEFLADGNYSVGGVKDEDKYLEVKYSKRKPFIVGKSSSDFEYGEKGPTLDALGTIKSLNKKAISKDEALEQMIRPALQGPSSLRKSYITTKSNSFVPLDVMSASKGGLKSIFEVNPGIAALTQDVVDLRQQVDRLYYADFLLFLSRNPKTRTATETNAIVQEQQLIIGPNLQSLNHTYNIPVVEFVMDYVLDNDPALPPPPPELEGTFLKPEFISVFAQAQRAADLPQVDRYISMISNVGQLRPEIWDKVNLNKIADIYEDRLYLPAGVNNPNEKVEAMRQQALAQQQRQQQLEQLGQAAKAAKDAGLDLNETPQG